ncbi:MAG: hypothetical protein HY940_02250 [Gammaproteobacteria bacterium]|nr:hypothetical protein [Gammaproteobacteria bacterium]
MSANNFAGGVTNYLIYEINASQYSAPESQVIERIAPNGKVIPQLLCVDCVNHVRSNVTITATKLLESDIKIWKYYLPKKFIYGSFDKHNIPIYAIPALIHIDQLHNQCAFDRIEIWSSDDPIITDYISFGFKDGAFYELARWNADERLRYKELDDVKTLLRKILRTDKSSKINQYLVMQCFIIPLALLFLAIIFVHVFTKIHSNIWSIGVIGMLSIFAFILAKALYKEMKRRENEYKELKNVVSV